MRRLLLAGALAVAIHGYLLGSKPEWLNRRPHPRPRPPVITMTLSYRPALSPQPEPPEVDLKKSVTIPKKEKPKPVFRPRPLKKVEKGPRKVPRPKKKKVRAPQKRPTEPEEKAVGPPPRPVITSFKPEKQIPATAVPHVVSSGTGAAPEPEKPEVTEGSPDFWADIPDDILEEPAYDEKAGIASLSPSQPIRKARPAYKKNPRPEYPRLARRRGYQGSVILEVLVGLTGRVNDIRVLMSSGYEILDHAAVASVRGWLFEPGMRGDEKVEMWVRVPIRFELK